MCLIEKEPIVLQFGRRCDLLPKETSIRKSIKCNFLSEQSTPKTEWKDLAIKKGDVRLKELSNRLSVH